MGKKKIRLSDAVYAAEYRDVPVAKAARRDARLAMRAEKAGRKAALLRLAVSALQGEDATLGMGSSRMATRVALAVLKEHGID